MIKFVLAISILATAGAASAQHAGSEQEQQACARDVHRYCRQLIGQGDSAILTCLQQNRGKLGTACGKVLTDNGK